MTLKRVTAPFFALLVICIPSLAQSPAPSQSQEAQSQTEDRALEKKALALLDDVVGEAMTLKLVENRIYALSMAADLFWKRNEDRARALLREAVNQFMLIEQPTEPDDPRAIQTVQLRMELRTQLLQTLATRDSRMALDFLRASRISDARFIVGGKGAALDFERQFEMQLAARVAENDPQTALQIAEENLKEGLSPQVFEIWSNLLGKDSKTAAKLSGEIMSAMKTSDMSRNYQPMALAFSMLNFLRSRLQEPRPDAKGAQPAQAQQPSIQEMRQTFRELLEMVISAALKVTSAQLLDINEQGQARNLLMQVQTLMPDIEKQLPARAGQMRAKLAQFDKAFYHPPAPIDLFSGDIEKLTAEELLANAASAPAEVKESIYRQAAMKSLQQGDSARARRIAKEFLPSGGLGDPLFAEIESAERERAVADGKMEEARKSISRMRSDEERAMALTELALKAEASQDQKSQRQLLGEAGELLGNQMETRSQVEAQLNLAVASLNIGADRGFEILGSAIDRLNVVLNAVTTLTRFDQRLGGLDGNSLDGEMRLNAGEFGNVTTNLDRQILAFARKDFDRTVALLKHWQVNEVRLAMTLSLVDGILGEKNDRRRDSRFERVR